MFVLLKRNPLAVREFWVSSFNFFTRGAGLGGLGLGFFFRVFLNFLMVDCDPDPMQCAKVSIRRCFPCNGNTARSLQCRYSYSLVRYMVLQEYCALSVYQRDDSPKPCNLVLIDVLTPKGGECMIIFGLRCKNPTDAEPVLGCYRQRYDWVGKRLFGGGKG